MRWPKAYSFAFFLLVATLSSIGPCQAAGILVESYPTMAAFLSSPLYDYITHQLPGGTASNAAVEVDSVAQGGLAVPFNSAGGPANMLVTPEVTAALIGAPTIFTGSSDSSTYSKQYVSLGNAATGETIPYISVGLAAVSTASIGGYNGYDIAIVELGENLAPGTGLKNSERSRFDVGWSVDGSRITVGTITNTAGNFINVILLNLDNLPGAPPEVDQVYVVDASGQNPPVRGSLDIDGFVRLNAFQPTPVVSATWGELKSRFP